MAFHYTIKTQKYIIKMVRWIKTNLNCFVLESLNSLIFVTHIALAARNEVYVYKIVLPLAQQHHSGVHVPSQMLCEYINN